MTGLILDQHVRYVGDPVAIIAGEDEKCVDRALKMLKVNTKCFRHSGFPEAAQGW